MRKPNPMKESQYMKHMRDFTPEEIETIKCV